MDRPPLREAGAQRVDVESDFRRPVGHGVGATLMSQERVRSRISSLLRGCRPAAVAGRVWPIIVNAVDRMLSAWPRAHVGVEALERVPLRSHENAPGSVIGEIAVSGIRATGAQLPPRFMFHGLRQTVCRVHLRHPSRPVAPARGDATASEIARIDRCHGAAVATAFPARLAVVRTDRGQAQHRQLPVAVAGEVEVSRCHCYAHCNPFRVAA